MEDDSRRLYPLRFVTEGDDRPWGHQSYHLADLGFRESMVKEGWLGGSTLSEVMETYLERIVGDDVFEFYGTQFPLMVKTLDIKGRLPLMVNVPDDVAFERYDSLGKAALWYVRDAGPDSVIYLGFSRDIDAGELYRRISDGTLEDVLNAVHPHAGDAFLLSPGLVFSAGHGLKLVEISESSELSFNLFNWGEPFPEGEDSLLEEALDIIDYSGKEVHPITSGTLAGIPEFHVTRIDLSAALHISSEQPGSFTVYFCPAGEASVQVREESGSLKEHIISEGQCLLLPSELTDFFLVPLKPGTVLLEALVEHRVVLDEYTGEEAKASDSFEADDSVPDPHVKTWS